MKRLILAPLLLCLITSANTGIDHYPNYQKAGIVLKSADNKANHIVELKPGRTLELKGYGEKRFKNLELFMGMPYRRWGNGENKMFTYKFLTQEETKAVIDDALKRYGINKKYCKGMN